MDSTEACAPAGMPDKFRGLFERFCDHMAELAGDEVPGNPPAHALMALGLICVSYPFSTDTQITLDDFRMFGQNMLKGFLVPDADDACNCADCSAKRALNESNADSVGLFNPKRTPGQC